MKRSSWLFAAWLSLTAASASAQTCPLLLGSELDQESDLITLRLTPDALSWLGSQYYLPGYLTNVLQQACSVGEPLASQLSYIFSRVVLTSPKDQPLLISVLNDDQLSPYTFETRTATVWVQGVEQKITLPRMR